MKRKHLLILALIPLVSGCNKTNLLYEKNAYNSSNFRENYYTDYDGLDELNLSKANALNTSITVVHKSSFDKKMSDQNEEYTKGILSKLYDGRVDCGGYYQLSRVQLNENGFGTKTPETLDVDSFSFSVRGGSTCETPLSMYLDFDFYISLYTNEKEYQLVFDGNLVPTDYSNQTKLFKTTFTEIKGVIGYSMKFTCSEFESHKQKENDELSMMLYEVVLD